MVLVEDDKYKETLKILRGEKELLPIYLDLKNWMLDMYGILAYNFIFEKIQYNNPENRYQLYILLSSTSDYNSIMEKSNYGYDESKQEAISKKFNELALKYKYGNIKTTNNVWICYNDFSVEMKTDVNNRACKECCSRILSKYSNCSLWNIYTAFTSVVVFFYQDVDIKNNTENGICELVRDDYYVTLKKHDEFNVYNSNNFIMNFDSKENLDKNYSGNLYYYFK